MGILIKQPPFHNVGAGQVCNLPRLDMGDTCDALLLKLSGNLEESPSAVPFVVDHLEAITVKLGGKFLVPALSGAEIRTINNYMLRDTNVVSDRFLMIRFADDMARTITGEDMGAVDTSLGYSSFNMEVKIAGLGGSGGNPSLECWMVKSAPKADGPYKPMFRAYTKSVESFNAASTFNLSPAMGSDVGNILTRLHIFTPNEKVEEIAVKKNGIEIWGDGSRDVMQFLAATTRAPQTGHIAYDPVYTNNQSDSITTIRPNGSPATMEIRAKLSGAETLTEIAELYSYIDTI